MTGKGGHRWPPMYPTRRLPRDLRGLGALPRDHPYQARVFWRLPVQRCCCQKERAPALLRPHRLPTFHSHPCHPPRYRHHRRPWLYESRSPEHSCGHAGLLKGHTQAAHPVVRPEVIQPVTRLRSQRLNFSTQSHLSRKGRAGNQNQQTPLQQRVDASVELEAHPTQPRTKNLQ